MIPKPPRLRSRRPASYYREWKLRSRPHRHQRMVSRVIRRLCEQLHLTQAQLAEQIGVAEWTIRQWAAPKGAAHPAPKKWERIRELWRFMQHTKTAEFMKDREGDKDVSLSV